MLLKTICDAFGSYDLDLVDMGCECSSAILSSKTWASLIRDVTLTQSKRRLISRIFKLQRRVFLLLRNHSYLVAVIACQVPVKLFKIGRVFRIEPKFCSFYTNS